MTYITHTSTSDTDLILGDLLLSSFIDVQSYIDLAFDEMEIHLSHCYAVPLPDASALVAADLKHLTFIQRHLATGRLFIAQAGATTNESLNAYGEYLIRMGMERLNAICPHGGENGGSPSVTLTSVDPAVNTLAGGAVIASNAPVVVNADGNSAVDAFMSFVGIRDYDPWNYIRPATYEVATEPTESAITRINVSLLAETIQTLDLSDTFVRIVDVHITEGGTGLEISDGVQISYPSPQHVNLLANQDLTGLVVIVEGEVI